MAIDVLMDSDSQRLFVNSMISSPELFTRVNPILRPEYFDAGMQGAVRFLQEYFEKNRAVPAPQIFQAATKTTPEIFAIQRQDLEFLANQIAGFCQASAMILVARKSPSLIEKGNYQELIEQFKAAAQIGLMDDLGIEYFENPEARLERQESSDALISTGWKDVDALIGGGVGRQELITFLAPSGGGKSVNMLNLGVNFMEQGLNGVVISIEMKDTKFATRTDQMIARLSSRDILPNKTKVAHEIREFHNRHGARLFIKRMREGETNSNHILAYLRQLESAKGFRPDWIVVDYLDILQSARKVDNAMMFLKDQFVTEEVRGIGYDYDAVMISGSQLGKHATEAINDGRTMHQGDVQGGSSKTNTSDLMIATVKTDAMHEAGEYRFEFIKARNSDATGKSCMMRWNKDTLRVSDGSAPALSLARKEKRGLQVVTPGAQKMTIDDLTKNESATADK
jgi:archaellum biogenesis ATPase FlaH